MNTDMFHYFDDPSAVSSHPQAWIAHIPRNLDDKLDLFRSLSGQLQFPNYFGHNWDALFDCLCDLHWIPNYEVCILHDDLPLKGSNEDQESYIAVLKDACKSWKQGNGHVLIILFPSEYKTSISSCINDIEYK
jgi:RNAse (barnase) inhibitor barstar